MLEIELKREELQSFIDAMARLKGDKVYAAVRNASKRGATTARKVGTQKLKGIYELKKTKVLKSGMTFLPEKDGTTLTIRGILLPITNFKAKKNKKGPVFVTVKKGKTVEVPNAFKVDGSTNPFAIRLGKSRLPTRGLYGPSLPQMMGNKDVVNEMEKAGMDMFENRLFHEVERVIK